MEISLCMIVKDEESNLRTCLQNVGKFVDEIVIIDTGSKDNTKEIARQFTEHVYEFKWCGDFAKARNYSLEKASNDWVLVLDADEVVNDFNREKLNEFMKDNEKLVGRIKIINIFEDKMGTKRYIERVNRVFNKKYFQYQGIIHEQIVFKNNEDYKTKNVDITVEHTGYTKEVVKKTNKINRNLELLKESIKKNNKDSYLYYQLGKTYYMDKQYENANIEFSRALDFPSNTKYEYVQDLIETYGYSLINTNKYSHALDLIKKYDKDYGELLDFKFLKALIYMNNGMFEMAAGSFMECIGENEGKIEGVNSYLAYYNIGVIFECLGYKQEALGYYEKANIYKPALERINIINNIL